MPTSPKEGPTVTQPAQQPPAGPPQQAPQPQQGQQGQQPPPDAPPATPAPNPPQPQQQPPAQPWQQQWHNPYGQPPTPPQQPPPPQQGWPPPPAPGQQLPQPYPPHSQPAWPGQYGNPAPGQPSTQPPQGQQPPAGDPNQGTGDGGEGQGYDPARLPKAARDEIQRLREQNQQRETQLRTATVSQHAHGVAGQHGVNPQALFGSLAWQQAAAQLDPAAPDYQQRLAWTVQAIAQQNPWMAAQPTQPPNPANQPPPPPPSSGGDFPGGTGAGQPITEAQLAQMSPDDIAKAYAEGKLKHLM